MHRRGHLIRAWGRKIGRRMCLFDVADVSQHHGTSRSCGPHPATLFGSTFWRLMYDLIGDIHGHADKLKKLLRALGYAERDGVYTHPERKVIFVGDFIDRGPSNREVIQIARRMTENGALAVMGNHEFNALAYATPDPQTPGAFLRPHSEKNTKQHGAFLAQFAAHPAERQECLSWFTSLPMFLELEGIRVVHACWHQAWIAELAPRLGEGHTLTPELLQTGSRPGHADYRAIETILKGPEIALPDNAHFHDKDGTRRKEVRVKWWLNDDQTKFEDLVLGPPAAKQAAAEFDAPALPFAPYPPDATPVFVGHYWLTGKPAPLTANVACLDYSVARNGPLVAYRWHGERVLDARNMVAA